MKKIKIIAIILCSMILLFVGTAFTYRLIKIQKVTETYSINQNSEKVHILIVTQQSNFKDNVMNTVSEYFDNKPIYIKIIDATKSQDINPEEWDFIQILTTVQSGNLQENVSSFLKEYTDYSNIALLITADSREWKHKDIDISAITSASVKENIEDYARRIIENINKFLNDK